MQTKKTPIQPQLTNAIQSLFNRVLLVFLVCLTFFAQAASGTRITQKCLPALYIETTIDITA